MGRSPTRRGEFGALRWALRIVVVAVAYWASARIGLALAIDDQFTPLWVASGVAFIATLRWGPGVLPAVLVADAFAEWQVGIPLAVALAIGAGNAAEALVATTIVQRLGMHRAIRRVRDVFVLLVAIALAASLSATVAVTASTIGESTSLATIAGEWTLFWSSAVLAVILVAPFVLALLDEGIDIPRIHSHALEAGVAVLVIVVMSAYVLDGTHPYASVLLYPVFIWAALRFGVVGAAGSILLAAVVAVGYELGDQDVLPELGLDRSESVLAVQAMLATAAIGNIVLATSLRERDRSRVELERSARALAHAQSIAALGSWEWVLRSDIVRVSDEFARLFQLERGRVTVDDILARVPADERDRVTERLADAAASGDSFTLEHRIHHGVEERVVRHAARVVGRGSDRRLVATALDVTERTSLDRLRDALVATASHELRTPLTSIVGFADTLLEHWNRFDDSRRLEFLRIIRSQGQRLSTVVDDTLMQSRLDAGSLAVTDEPYPVAPSILDAVLLSGVENVTILGDTSLVAVGNQEHLTQIVLNFLTNAAKYGEPPFEVLVHDTEDGSQVEVEVVDHGPGVDPAFRERLFERFTRGPGTDAQPGTGLGLSIVRGLAEANHGGVSHRRDGDRTIFSCTVPRWTHELAAR